ncbi:MAG: DUF2027 domain-containing protein [Bacteroidota bacterium]
MLFAIGTKVKFLHTGDEGVVKARLEKGMVSVYLPKDDMEIPAAEVDLIRIDDVVKSSSVKAKVVPGKKEKQAPQRPAIKIQTQYAILKSFGIQLAFLPVENSAGLTEKFKIYLINDTKYEILYNIKFWLDYRTQTWSDKLSSTSYLPLGEMVYDDLNEAPEFEVEINWLTTEGVGKPTSKTLKIKAKSFFKTMRTAPLLNKPTHLYKLFEKPDFREDTKAEDLSAYTKRHAKPSWYKGDNARTLNSVDTSELANFSREIDLHIEKLRDDWEKMSNAEIISIQLIEFENYLQQSIRLGAPSVFIIHGVGKGRLRDEIATRLFKNTDVKTFKNEYHPKYGWGATEVIFE